MSERQVLNPKTLMGRTKLPMFSVVPAVALIHMAHAMRYGAYEALKKDGTRGYGPFNWREIGIEYSTYLDAAERHLKAFEDGEDVATDSLVHHLGHTMATCGILLDAIECGTAIDDRPKIGRGVAVRLMDRLKMIHAVGYGEPAPPSMQELARLAASLPEPSDYCTACNGYGEHKDPTEQFDDGCIDCAGTGDGVVQRAINRGKPARDPSTFTPTFEGHCDPRECDPSCPGPAIDGPKCGRGLRQYVCELPAGHAGGHKCGDQLWTEL